MISEFNYNVSNVIVLMVLTSIFAAAPITGSGPLFSSAAAVYGISGYKSSQN